MKFKKWVVFLIIPVMMIPLAGCFGGGESTVSEESTSLKEQGMDETVESAQTPEVNDDGVVDLTVLSSTMVYSQVYDMMVHPENFIGKTVKMKGSFSMYEGEKPEDNIYACIIQDATACCSSGIEFERDGNFSYPSDYPEIGNEITVTGVFDTYDEDGVKYCTLRKALIQDF